MRSFARRTEGTPQPLPGDPRRGTESLGYFEVNSGQLASPFGELLELTEQAEIRDKSNETGERPGHYLRATNGSRQNESFGAVIDEILKQREEEEAALTGSGNGMNPDQIFSGQGSNVALLAEGVGFEPTGRLATPAGFQDQCIRPLCHPSVRPTV